MTRSQSLSSRFSIILIAGLFVAVAACEDMFAPDKGAGGASNPEPDNGNSSGASSGGETPDPDPDPDPDPSPDPALPEGWFMSPGDLIAGTTLTRGSTGVTDNVRVAPDMRFPIETGPAFANSQIFMPGGFGYADGSWEGPGGHENARENFEYPWRDDYCEVRNNPRIHKNALCPGGRGHQGQDIRAQTCENAVYWVVAPENGYISYVGGLSFNFRGDSGLKYRFMHVDLPPPDRDEYDTLAAEGTFVRYKKGARIGLVSDLYTGGSRVTTVHVHFEIIGAAKVNGKMTGNQALPPYSSLVAAYERLVGDNPEQINPVALPLDGGVCNAPQRP